MTKHRRLGMTDITEELRAGAELEEAYDADGIIRTGYQRSLRWRAADEIERLRKEVLRLQIHGTDTQR